MSRGCAKGPGIEESSLKGLVYFHLYRYWFYLESECVVSASSLAGVSSSPKFGCGSHLNRYCLTEAQLLKIGPVGRRQMGSPSFVQSIEASVALGVPTANFLSPFSSAFTKYFIPTAFISQFSIFLLDY